MKVLIVLGLLLGYGQFCLSEEVEESENPRVVTPLGIIEGFYNTSDSGQRYETYMGIPYAQPPTGESRFEVAKPVSPWSAVFMAKEFSSPCMQYNYILLRDPADRVQGSEDCLYLNIYTPVVDETKRDANGTPIDLLPVIFFIPGGVFQIGNGNGYGPKYLLDNNVTLVTINYRLGPLGFLSTEDEVVPGNMGLKDQVIALRWVKDNIKSFGGDPARITIFGHSAGAASVHYHYLTNLTAGLFQGGMSISGTALNGWVLAKNPLEKAKRLAATVGCQTDNNRRMVDCLKTLPAHDLLQGMAEFTKWVYTPSVMFVPTVEKGGSEFTFIDREPIEIIASGDAHDVPWITGVVSEEGLYPVSFFIAGEDLLEQLNEKWEDLASMILNYNDTISASNKSKVARLIKQHYLGESPISRSTVNQTVQMIGDRLFVYSSEKAAMTHARANRGPVYGFYFSYRGAHSVTENLAGTAENFGVAHGDDLRYVIEHMIDPTTTSDDQTIHQLMTDLWVSFATNGTPNVGVEWPRLTATSTNEYTYLHIAGPGEIGMKSSSNFGEKEFWHSLDFQENILP